MLTESDYLRLAGATRRIDPDQDCDALHDAYLELHASFEQVGAPDMRLLMGRTKYRARDRWRRRTREARRHSHIQLREPLSPIRDNGEKDERLQQLSAAIASLRPAERRLIELHWVEGLSIPAIAARNNVSAQTLYSRHAAALRTLQSLILSGEVSHEHDRTS